MADATAVVAVVEVMRPIAVMAAVIRLVMHVAEELGKRGVGTLIDSLGGPPPRW